MTGRERCSSDVGENSEWDGKRARQEQSGVVKLNEIGFACAL